MPTGPGCEPEWSADGACARSGRSRRSRGDSCWSSSSDRRPRAGLVWLSQHRDRSTRSGARTALWETGCARRDVRQRRQRRPPGLARIGPPLDGRSGSGGRSPSSCHCTRGVVTDAEQLRAGSTQPGGHCRTTAIEVFGPASSSSATCRSPAPSYLWPDAEGITSQLTLLVDVRGDRARRALPDARRHRRRVLGDRSGPAGAAGHEELIALRMRAHARQGDLAGVRHEWEIVRTRAARRPVERWRTCAKLVDLRRELLASTLEPTRERHRSVVLVHDRRFDTRSRVSLTAWACLVVTPGTTIRSATVARCSLVSSPK